MDFRRPGSAATLASGLSRSLNDTASTAPDGTSRSSVGRYAAGAGLSEPACTSRRTASCPGTRRAATHRGDPTARTSPPASAGSALRAAPLAYARASASPATLALASLNHCASASDCPDCASRTFWKASCESATTDQSPIFSTVYCSLALLYFATSVRSFASSFGLTIAATSGCPLSTASTARFRWSPTARGRPRLRSGSKDDEPTAV